jgi:eukaryotic-like serine/threonine-protein kinase
VTTEKKQRVALPPGAVLDHRFEIVERLGAGAFGAVYRARQIVFGRKLREVALKLFETEKIGAENFGEVFNDAITLIGMQEEASYAASARHLIQVYDIGVLKTPDEQAFMSMKLVPGRKTLQDAVRRWGRARGMPIETALGYLRQILIPLAWMHTLDIPVVHGDLKPDNILLTDDSMLVLTDFGLAARLPLGSRGGAIAYQAPESLLHVSAKAPADIYSIGIIWYELLTGRHPFQDVGLAAIADDDQQALIRAHIEARKWCMRPADPVTPNEQDQRIVPASEINKQLLDHPQLEAMLSRCLQFDQSKRYLNAQLLLADIDRYVETGRLSTIVIQPKPDDDEPEIVMQPKTPEIRVQDALSLLKQGQPDTALDQIELALTQKKDFVPAILAKARILAAKKDFKNAREACLIAQAIDPKDPDVFGAMADVLLSQGKADLARNMRSQEQQLRQERSRSARR